MNKIINRANHRKEFTDRSKSKGLKVKWHRIWKMWKCNYIGVLLAMLTVALASCDGHHALPDTSMKIGHVLCTDGQVMTADECECSGREPIAVVFHVNSDKGTEGNGYAVYLHDLPALAFADSTGVAQGTSKDFLAYDGNANTHALYAQTVCGSPAANAVFALWKYGQSAYIPSVAQMRLLRAAKPFINNVLERLKGIPLPEEADETWYWTSTEVDGQETAKAWLYSLGSGAVQETPKLQSHKIRPIITLNE